MTIDYKLLPGRERKEQRKFKKHDAVISIVTPSWNPSENIFSLANCILNQTYPYFEWLIIDDGSTDDNSLKYYSELEKLDSRIKVFHKENGGPALARDYGVSVSSKDTEYVVFIDDDDLLDPTFLECAYYSMMANKEASWCYCDVLNFEGIESNWNRRFSSEVMKYSNLLVSQAMIKKSAFYEVDGFKLKGEGLYEDWIFWLKLLAKKHFPIHMSYYGFWYRRKVDSGQFNLANTQKRKNMSMVSKYAKEITNVVKPIEFPRENYNWDGITKNIDNLVIPNYEKDNKKTVLVMIPWMMLGGADKFNIDLFRLADKNKYRFIVVSMQPTEYAWRQKFEEVSDEVFDLSTFLDRKDWASFIDYLINSRKVDLVLNTNSQFGYALLPYIRSKYPELPIMDYIHMEEWYNRNGGYSRDSAGVGSVISKTLFCNKNSENILVDYFKRTRESVGTVYIGVDTDKFNPANYDKEALKTKYKIPANKTIVSLIARIDYQKRPYLMMKIIEEVLNKDKDLFFVIAGDGPLLKDVKKIASDKNINNIMFLGKTDKPDEIYAISDITLNCSIKEGLALTSYESLSMGVPVVSADVGGQKELINSKVGVIVPCLQKEEDIHDYNYLKEEIEPYVNGILKVKQNLNKYKKECRIHVVNNFSLNNMKVNMEKEIDKVIKNYKEDKSLVNHQDIALELINYFLLTDKQQYSWLVKKYNIDVYGSSVSVEEMSKRERLLYNCRDMASKLHMPEEAELVYKIGSSFINHLKNLLIAIVMLPVLVVKFIIEFILLEFNRIRRIIKRMVRK